MIKKARHEPYQQIVRVGREEESVLCDPGSELRLLYGRREKEEKGTTNGGGKRWNHNQMLCLDMGEYVFFGVRREF